MVRVSSLAGWDLRPNSSLAGVDGSSGWARGGSGCGLRVPLSCAVASWGTSKIPANNHKAMVLGLALRRTVRSGDVIDLVMLAISDRELRRPHRRTDIRACRASRADNPRDSRHQA